jgi:hypothetical protein
MYGIQETDSSEFRIQRPEIRVAEGAKEKDLAATANDKR